MQETTLEAKKESLVNTAIQCKQDENASDADVQELMGQELPSTKPGKCMRKCILEKLDLVPFDCSSVCQLLTLLTDIPIISLFF